MACHTYHAHKALYLRDHHLIAIMQIRVSSLACHLCLKVYHFAGAGIAMNHHTREVSFFQRAADKADRLFGRSAATRQITCTRPHNGPHYVRSRHLDGGDIHNYPGGFQMPTARTDRVIQYLAKLLNGHPGNLYLAGRTVADAPVGSDDGALIPLLIAHHLDAQYIAGRYPIGCSSIMTLRHRSLRIRTARTCRAYDGSQHNSEAPCSDHGLRMHDCVHVLPEYSHAAFGADVITMTRLGCSRHRCDRHGQTGAQSAQMVSSGGGAEVARSVCPAPARLDAPDVWQLRSV